MTSEIQCAIQQSKVSLTTPEGWKKEISPQAFMELLMKFYSEGGSGTRGLVFNLPRNTIRFETSPGRLYITTYHPECVKTVSHNQGWSGKIPVPNIVIFYELVKEEIGGESFWKLEREIHSATSASIAAVRSHDGILTFDQWDRLAKLPFPNVYSNGNICYGGNAMNRRFKLDQLAGLDYYYDFLFSTPFNNDLDVPVDYSAYDEWARSDHAHDQDLEERDEDDEDDEDYYDEPEEESDYSRSPLNWLKFLSNQTEFPYQSLR